MSLTLLLGGFALFMTLGTPVALAFLVAAVLYLLSSGIPLSVAGQSLIGGIYNYTLLAVPLYILAGELMNSGGITRRLFDFASALAGHVRGGLGHVNVVASIIFSGISGSSSADAAGLGRVEIEAMRKAGYRAEFAAAITAASSAIGPIIPPSIHLVLYAAIAEVGVDYLFLGGILPGLAMGACLMSVIYLLVLFKREDCPVQEWAGMRTLARAFWNALLPITAPLVIVGGILSGYFTPTEAGVTAVLYVAALGFILRELRVRQLAEAVVRSVHSSAVVLLILAAAQAFAWGLTVEQVPEAIAHGLLSISEDTTVVLAIILVVLVILGMFESASANLVIVTPILLPIAMQLGIDPVHLGIIIVLALTIGVVTPPVGMSLFIVADISGLPVGRIARATLPYVLALILALVLTTYLPDLVLLLPRLYGYAG
ncbi:TRAP transporter large permease [Nitratireductor pacificus]|uniref:TRAP transporter large permease protein n=1 Tax=Nitratireductor pacificus pht-3B TaxID=391937 RepID=K2MCZ4_9HYPH|nr:TRAP transporter large permease [Nitratireductor pacificus]EKF18615.1 putative TRAP dicarboxylate transporter [Nitratireductor pacificus pht-3B]